MNRLAPRNNSRIARDFLTYFSQDPIFAGDHHLLLIGDAALEPFFRYLLPVRISDPFQDSSVHDRTTAVILASSKFTPEPWKPQAAQRAIAAAVRRRIPVILVAMEQAGELNDLANNLDLARSLVLAPTKHAASQYMTAGLQAEVIRVIKNAGFLTSTVLQTTKEYERLGRAPKGQPAMRRERPITFPTPAMARVLARSPELLFRGERVPLTPGDGSEGSTNAEIQTMATHGIHKAHRWDASEKQVFHTAEFAAGELLEIPDEPPIHQVVAAAQRAWSSAGITRVRDWLLPRMNDTAALNALATAPLTLRVQQPITGRDQIEELVNNLLSGKVLPRELEISVPSERHESLLWQLRALRPQVRLILYPSSQAHPKLSSSNINRVIVPAFNSIGSSDIECAHLLTIGYQRISDAPVALTLRARFDNASRT